ncbi:ABC transporter permease [Thiocapsa bogorovii]|uniref:ABC transporter permease n=1 Tax=Thiocapsa bogorovii TaxID=521689 RepID=UPI001E2EB8B6|nr:ABC transporter permease [Thiocapsa bogorovii]UHD16759.1 ABC transporter permease [Thiocapsa bogorovii]
MPMRDHWILPRPGHGALAVWHRNIRVWRKLIGPAVVLNFGEPTLYLLGLGFGLGSFIGTMSDMPYLAFLASGIIASSAMTTASFEGMYSVFTRMDVQRTYDAMLATPLTLDDILAGEMLWCATKALFSGAAILTVAALLGVVAGPGALLALPVAFLIGLCFAGPAMIMAALAPNYDFFNYYFVLVVTPMLILSGVFYPIDTLPVAMQTVVQLFPLTHAVALTRPLVAGQPLDGVLLHLSVLAAYAAVGFYLAVALTRRRLLV